MPTSNEKEIKALQKKLAAENAELGRWAQKMSTFMHYWQDGIRGTGSTDGPRQAEEVCSTDFLGLADEEDRIVKGIQQIEKRLIGLGATFDAPQVVTTGQRIRRLMEEADVTPEWVAEKTRMSVKSVLRHMNDQATPVLDNFQSYARFFSEQLGRPIKVSDLLPA
jgi:hypothetical protein